MSSPERILRYAWGYAPPLIIEAALRHKVFDALSKAPMTAVEMSAATGASVRGLTAIMNALTGLELLAKDGDTYNLTTESAAYLVSGSPGYLGGMIDGISTQRLPKWLDLANIVREGRPGTVEGEAFFPFSYEAVCAAADALGLAEATGPIRVLDLAGNSGAWGLALAEKSPHVSVTETDFGTGYDIGILGHISRPEILRKAFDALVPGGTIVIADILVDPSRKTNVMGLLFDVNMLVTTENGGLHSYEEIKTWLQDAGFVRAGLVPAPGPSPLIFADKP